MKFNKALEDHAIKLAESLNQPLDVVKKYIEFIVETDYVKCKNCEALIDIENCWEGDQSEDLIVMALDEHGEVVPYCPECG